MARRRWTVVPAPPARARTGPIPRDAHTRECWFRRRSPPPLHGLEEGIAIIQIDARPEPAAERLPLEAVGGGAPPGSAEIGAKGGLDDRLHRDALIGGLLPDPSQKLVVEYD